MYPQRLVPPTTIVIYSERMEPVFDSRPAPCPCLTAALPGVGGVIRRHNRDFLVEELPLYEPSGEGTHVYFRIEKDGLTTHQAVAQIARALHRTPREVGYAGLKDAHAVTRQTLSLEHVDPQRVAELRLPRICILDVSRHGNKLKLGHLRANRFTLRIREIEPDAEAKARAVMEVLARRGLPNYFGEQRFGARGDTWRVGRAAWLEAYEEALRLALGTPTAFDRGPILEARRKFDAGEYEASSRLWFKASVANAKVCRALARRPDRWDLAWRGMDVSMRKLYINAFQSHLFNHVLALRIDAIDRVEAGDMAYLHRNGACFRVQDAVAEQPRCDAFEISPTGPLFGRRMTPAEGEPGRIEAQVLEDNGLSPDVIASRGGAQEDGARRPLRVPLSDAACAAGEDEHGAFLELRFELPSGSYATCVLSEVCKRPSA